MRIAVESDNELNRALSSAAAAAASGNLGFPIRELLVEAAKSLASLGDGRPGFVRAGRVGNETTGRDGNLTCVGRFAFGHAEAASLFGRGGKF